MSAEKMNAELEPALGLIDYHCVGCYFEHTNPCDWDVNKIIGEMSEKIGKGHKTRPHRKEVKT